MHAMFAEDIGPAVREIGYLGIAIVVIVVAFFGIRSAVSGHKASAFLCVVPAFGWGVFQTIRLAVIYLMPGRPNPESEMNVFLFLWCLQAVPSFLGSLIVAVIILLITRKRTPTARALDKA
jgi:hypothetical protein